MLDSLAVKSHRSQGGAAQRSWACRCPRPSASLSEGLSCPALCLPCETSLWATGAARGPGVCAWLAWATRRVAAGQATRLRRLLGMLSAKPRTLLPCPFTSAPSHRQSIRGEQNTIVVGGRVDPGQGEYNNRIGFSRSVLARGGCFEMQG